jgi:hypothetical protein
LLWGRGEGEEVFAGESSQDCSCLLETAQVVEASFLTVAMG